MTSFSVPKPFQKFNSAAAEKTIVEFIQNTVKDSGTNGVVLGLSGGIDSALVAALSVKALGAENVYPIFFYESADDPSQFDSADFRDASQICNQFNLTLQKVNLSSLFSEAFSAAPSATPSATHSSLNPVTKNSISAGNLKSRLRMSLLYYYANNNTLLVIGTKNKTERLTGYYTKYGDGAVDLDPIADLYKTEVRLLSQYLGLPESILSKAPSAGFWDGQSDEDDFGVRYDQLDSILYVLEKNGQKLPKSGSDELNEILKMTNLSEKQYESILSRMDSAKHKQKLPDFPKIS
ncbi:NAD+ synthase [Methanimicrococcus blatticola]|uniref:NH(3)-dependent NAD(+) synthetase n=1 Tax=Methanimicrococcus blatticola TaxID=91560 RepID=A0A484F3X8_9EURY|nr:NAD+ synthase [Methanimicrococcus blatticola]MBZ3935855.1 NAD+ synthase [Methanimicrococcus blatticola]MCC2508024.1 NAD+ synthase [Methanimicrococcus blatticola]TDQ68893.1 NH(3)-dependent NAD(+) synthetase [Methanimicrococcus blatticola]